MNEKTEHTDLLGRKINVGDYIVYSAAHDRSAVLRVGQVLELKFVPENTYSDNPKMIAKVFCKSWSNFRSEGWDWENDKAIEKSGRQKNVTLGFLTRVAVVEPSTISEKIKKDLDGPICDYWGEPIKK